MTGIGGHHSARSKSVSWITPPDIIEALGGPESFDLDPCAATPQPWPCARHSYTVRDDGLALPWFGRCYVNPPYSTRAIGRWLQRLAEHGTGIALIFARTETEAFFSQVWERANALLFLRSPRVHFHRPDGSRAPHNCGAPVVLCAYGMSDMDLLSCEPVPGQFVPLRFPRGIVLTLLEQCTFNGDKNPTWREELSGLLGSTGPIALADIYRHFSTHFKARGRAHWRAQIRKVLQEGPFTPVARGVWAMEGS